MVELAGHYDEQAAPNADFGPIPSGEYEAEIIESSVEEISKTGNKGRCLLVVWKILDGEYEGRQVWQRMNLWFTGDEKTPGKVVQIANAEFASIREATGRKTPADSTELHNIRCVIRVALVKQQGYDDKNEVKHVKATGTHQPFSSTPSGAPRSAPPASPRSGPAAGQGGGAPWRKAG